MFLQIKNLRVGYNSDGREVEVVRGVSLEIKKGECLGIVGESGCGKTTLGLAITKLIPSHKGRILSGEIIFEDKDILKMDEDALRKLRGDRISYVFQEPFSSLNPVFTIYSQIAECIKVGENTDDKIAEVLKNVGLEKIIGRKNLYPHELSGGMQQRVMIAMAIASNPDLLVLDEPTTALDVTVQSQILDLIMDLKEKMRLSILFISHDLRTVFKISNRIAVMYAGVIAEQGQAQEIMSRPRHPYTSGLLDSMPSFERRKQIFNAIEGKAPLFADLPQGCKFYPRCRYRMDKCLEKEPIGCIRQGELKLNGIIKSK